MKSTNRTTVTALTALALMLLTAASLHAATLPSVSSAGLTYHLDAYDMNNDNGATNPGDGNAITSWIELNSGVSANIQSTPTYQATAIAGGPAVRFDGGAAGGDLVYSNNPAIFNIQARTIYVVASMASDAFILSDVISNSSGTATIRQTTAETANYFTGNTGDFHTLGGGTTGQFAINGSATFAIPGGFGSPHVVRSISPSAVNINSLRIGDNAANRIWAGDVAEVIVFNGRLSGNDTVAINKYLEAKYGIAQIVDERILESKQIADDPFADYAGQVNYGVNFHYNGPNVTSTFMGIGFDNVDVQTLPAGPIALAANANNAGATLTLGWTTFALDNTVRSVAAGITGTDAATLNAVTSEMFYLSSNPPTNPDHHHVSMLFAGLKANTEVYVQVLGGDNNWTGTIDVDVNGVDLGFDWLANATHAGNSASLFAFFATTDALGQLDLDFSLASGNFAGISGIILSVAVPTPAALPAGLGLLALAATRRNRRRSA